MEMLCSRCGAFILIAIWGYNARANEAERSAHCQFKEITIGLGSISLVERVSSRKVLTAMMSSTQNEAVHLGFACLTEIYLGVVMVTRALLPTLMLVVGTTNRGGLEMLSALVTAPDAARSISSAPHGGPCRAARPAPVRRRSSEGWMAADQRLSASPDVSLMLPYGLNRTSRHVRSTNGHSQRTMKTRDHPEKRCGSNNFA